MAKGRVLHLLSQRPLLTGSGITLDALVRHAAAVGWEQRVVVGVPQGESSSVGDLPTEHIHPLHFGGEALDFHVPGMSDVMPY
ncbi:MAG: glycosyltransferase family 4 protein, partial [Planctomycetes bacterium]|nr:glycosyltransferase family 4 protein [Planctomycetota bacterium]